MTGDEHITIWQSPDGNAYTTAEGTFDDAFAADPDRAFAAYTEYVFTFFRDRLEQGKLIDPGHCDRRV